MARFKKKKEKQNHQPRPRELLPLQPRDVARQRNLQTRDRNAASDPGVRKLLLQYFEGKANLEMKILSA